MMYIDAQHGYVNSRFSQDVSPGHSSSTEKPNNQGDATRAPNNTGASHGSYSKVSLSSTSLRLSQNKEADDTASVEQTSNESTESTSNPYANTILTAISSQLQADISSDHSTERLQSRLEAGLSGFLQGFAEAFEQLDAIPEFTDDIRSKVLETKTQVLDGLAQLAEELGLDASAITEAQASHEKELSASKPDEPEPDLGLAGIANSFSGGQLLSAQANTFSFSLITEDGDKVTILASTLEAIQVQKDKDETSAERAEKNAFSLEVEGELDEDELAAINDLLNQVSEVSSSFFSGSIENAFAQALDMGFDSSEISSFALKLTQTSYTEIQNAYQPDDTQANPSQNLREVGELINHLESTYQRSERYGLEKQVVVELLEAVSIAKGEEPEPLMAFLDKL